MVTHNTHTPQRDSVLKLADSFSLSLSFFLFLFLFFFPFFLSFFLSLLAFSFFHEFLALVNSSYILNTKDQISLNFFLPFSFILSPFLSPFSPLRLILVGRSRHRYFK